MSEERLDDPLDVCPQCNDPWCSCDCALCVFVTNSEEANGARNTYDKMANNKGYRAMDRYRLMGADRHCLDGSGLRKAYYRSLFVNPERN